MTDKQVIIDGVNICYCPNHYNGWSALHRDTRPMCECGYDRECKPKYFQCSYYVKCLEQKLQAKDQECETLKDEIFHLRNEGKKSCAYCADFVAKEQECEELKKINKANAISFLKFWFKFKKYKKAIDNIKEIAENGKRFAESYMITGEQKTNVLTYANAILQKSSECEGDNEV